MSCSISYSLFLCIILWCFINNCFTKFGSSAQLIPPDEVKTLQIISEKLENTQWRVSQKSCSDGGRSFNRTFGINILSNVTCDCSFNSSTVCHVTHIHLKGLNLTGFLPEEFGNLPQLQEIDLARNYVNGTIPKSLSKIPLVTLSLMENRHTGPIPSEIGQIATLEELILEDNRLEGPLPKSLGNLKNLKKLAWKEKKRSGRKHYSIQCFNCKEMKGFARKVSLQNFSFPFLLKLIYWPGRCPGCYI